MPTQRLDEGNHPRRRRGPICGTSLTAAACRLLCVNDRSRDEQRLPPGEAVKPAALARRGSASNSSAELAREVGARLLEDSVELHIDLVVPLPELVETRCVVEVADRLTEGFESFGNLPAGAEDA